VASGFFGQMKQRAFSIADQDASAASPIRERILRAAFQAFTEEGYAATSTLEIAKRAKISKRDLYANFASKQEMLVACISSRAERTQPAAGLPTPDSRAMLASTLTAFATNLVRESSRPAVIATFRLAIAEATRAPEVAETLDQSGREATRNQLAQLLARAQSAGLLGPGEPIEMAAQYLGLLWEGLMIGLLLGVAAPPLPAETEQRASTATAAFLQLHPGAGKMR